MQLDATDVGILACHDYDRQLIKEKVDAIFAGINFTVACGSKVLLKPNLIAGGNKGLPCTHPEVVAAVAEWLLDQGAQVAVGDSPAFGSALKVMGSCGITAALEGLPVRLVNFRRPRQVRLAGGFRTGIEIEALDCDVLVNLPKCKAHSQLMMTLAVKNLFGVVVGLRKPWIHARFGDVGTRFEELIVDLPAVLPDGVSLMDGIVAMHKTGPMNGEPYRLGILAGSGNPVALDTAVLTLLKCVLESVPLWNECRKRKLPGADPEGLFYPLERPEETQVKDFAVPAELKPISFNPGRLVISSIQRTVAHLKGPGE